MDKVHTTVSIPRKLKEEAKKQHIPLSKTLEVALENELNPENKRERLILERDMLIEELKCKEKEIEELNGHIEHKVEREVVKSKITDAKRIKVIEGLVQHVRIKRELPDYLIQEKANKYGYDPDKLREDALKAIEAEGILIIGAEE